MGSKSKALISEFLGCFFLTLSSCYLIYLQNSRYSTVQETALAYGVLTMVTVLCSFSFSGAHLNPSISIALMIFKKIPFSVGFFYVVIQVSASLFAALVAVLTLPSRLSGYHGGQHNIPDDQQDLPIEEKVLLGYPYLNPLLTDSQGFLIEFLLSFFYVFVFYGMTVDK